MFWSVKCFYDMPLNRRRTYQAKLSEGSDQEKAFYILTTRQRVVKIIGQWVALYSLLLKEDPIALDSLEVGIACSISSFCLIITSHFKNIHFRRKIDKYIYIYIYAFNIFYFHVCA